MEENHRHHADFSGLSYDTSHPLFLFFTKRQVFIWLGNIDCTNTESLEIRKVQGNQAVAVT